MADPLDIVEEQATRDQRDRLGQAAHDASWLSTFSGPQSTAALRAKRDVSQLAQDVLDRKMALAAQTDEHAMQIYATGKHLEEFQRQAPLRENLLNAQIAAQGASTRFQQAKDTETLQHTAGALNAFADPNAPKTGTPEFIPFAAKVVTQYPRFATTEIGKQTLKNIAQDHDTTAQLYSTAQQLAAEHPGATYSQDKDTGGYYVKTGQTNPAGGDAGAELAKIHRITPTELLNPVSVQFGEKKGATFVPDSNGKTGGRVAQIDIGRGSPVQMSAAEYGHYKDALSPKVPAPATTAPSPTVASIPKHLGTYNPKSGNFE